VGGENGVSEDIPLLNLLKLLKFPSSALAVFATLAEGIPLHCGSVSSALAGLATLAGIDLSICNSASTSKRSNIIA
jgi:hypothetical protein